MNEPILLFVLGLPRSGTHLMRFALAKSPSIAFVPETAILYKYWGSRLIGRLFGRGFFSRIFARSLITGHGDPTMVEYMDREDAIARAARSTPSLESTKAVLGAFFKDAPRYLGEKSPNNTLHIRDFHSASRVNDGVKLILIRRDPYDQIASSVRTKHISGGLTAALARHHVYHAALEGVDCYEVSYEVLVMEPEKTLRELCIYLEIAFSNQMLRPGVLDSSEGKTFFQQGDFGFIPDNIGKGRERLGPESSDRIANFLAHGPTSLPFGVRLIFIWECAQISRNRLMARLGLVMLKTAVKGRLFGIDSTGTREVAE